MDGNDAKRLARTWFETGMTSPNAEAARDMARELFAEDFVDHDGVYGETRTLDEFLATVIDPIFTAFSDVHVTIEHLIAEDDLVAIRYLFEGRQTGPFNGIPPTGHQIRHTENE